MSTSTSDTKRSRRVKAIDDYVRTIAFGMIEAIATRQFGNHPCHQALAPTWKFFDNHQSEPLSHSQYLAMLEETVASSPMHRVEMIDMSSQVDEVAGSASVIVSLDIFGDPPGVVRRTVGINEFKLRRGKWLCIKFTAIKGMRGVGGVD